MSSYAKKLVTWLIFAFLLLSMMDATYSEWNSPDYYWDFSNYCYLNFNETINFTDAPIQNVFNDSSLVGYWDMNAGSGDIMPDLSGNSNNGIIYGASWVDGKFGKALSFDGQSNYVEIPYNSSLDNFQAITISFWMYPTMWGDGYYRHILDKGWQTEGALLVYLDRSGQNLNFVTRDSVSQKISSFTLPSLNTWYFVTCVFQKGIPNKIYVNATKGKDSPATANESLILENGLRVAQNANDFAGIIDEICIYNRTLVNSEIVALYNLGTPESMSNYFNFKDPLNNNTMLIHVNSLNANSDNTVLVTCTNFFTGNKLIFKANSSAVVNVWTNLGQPTFTTGVWNNQNYTTTITLSNDSTGELSWNVYKITTFVDSHSSIAPSNITVSDAAYQRFTITSDSGYHISHVYVDEVDNGNITSYSFTNVTRDHVISVFSEATEASNSSTPTTPPSVSPTISPSPEPSSPLPSSAPQSIPSLETPFPVESVVIATIAIAILMAILGLALKKGYITLEEVEESPE